MVFHLKRRWGLVIAIAALATCLQIAPAQAAKRVALVIGNGAYRAVPSLINPTNDAQDISVAFERLGFAVHRITNATYDDMRRGLLEFGRQARGSEIAVVYFAGHGLEVGGENWLIPVDAELKTDLDVDHEAISLHSILPSVESAGTLGLVILDACRNNPFAAKMQRTIRTRAVARGLSGIEPNGNVLVAYSAKDGTTSADVGAGRNSPFTKALLKHIETPGLEISFVFRTVRDDVMKATNWEQQPFVYGSLSKQAIYLKDLPPVTIAPPPPAPAADEITWRLLKDTDDQVALKRFTEQFPVSKLRALAETRIAALTVEAQKKTAREQAARDEAEKARLAQERTEREKPAESAHDTQTARLTNPAEAAASKQTAPILTGAALVQELKKELKRVGCYAGLVDEKWSTPDTRLSIEKFVKYANVTIASNEPNQDLLDALRAISARICPLICGPGYLAKGETCAKMVCKVGFVVGDDGTCERRHEKPARRPTKRAKGSGEQADVDASSRNREVSSGGYRTCGRNGCQIVPKGCRAVRHGGGGGLGGRIVCP